MSEWEISPDVFVVALRLRISSDLTKFININGLPFDPFLFAMTGLLKAVLTRLAAGCGVALRFNKCCDAFTGTGEL